MPFSRSLVANDKTKRSLSSLAWLTKTLGFITFPYDVNKSVNARFIMSNRAFHSMEHYLPIILLMERFDYRKFVQKYG